MINKILNLNISFELDFRSRFDFGYHPLFPKLLGSKYHYFVIGYFYIYWEW